MALTTRTYSATASSGRDAVPEPIPRVNLPFESSCSVAAAIAVVTGERDCTVTTPVPSPTVDVPEANAASVEKASLAAISGTKTHS